MKEKRHRLILFAPEPSRTPEIVAINGLIIQKDIIGFFMDFFLT